MHTFGYLARSNYPSYCKSVKLFVNRVGWVVEGRKTSQLPEQLLASLRMIKVPTDANDLSVKEVDARLSRNGIRDGSEAFSISPAEWIRGKHHLK